MQSVIRRNPSPHIGPSVVVHRLHPMADIVSSTWPHPGDPSAPLGHGCTAELPVERPVTNKYGGGRSRHSPLVRRSLTLLSHSSTKYNHYLHEDPKLIRLYSIDGVLVRSANPIPGAHEALSFLQRERIPFILLTNGGGKSEEERVADLQEKLGVPLDPKGIVLSHTPFAELKEYHDKNVLVVGGDYDKSQLVAQKYGFKNAITPGDIVTAYPTIWPFAKVFLEYYAKFAKPLPKLINPSRLADSLKIDAMFVYNDSRDWGLDSAIMLDILLSQGGYIGTLSSKNGDTKLPNNGYQQDGQPPLFYSNPDLWWAASYHLNRLGQGGFQAAFEGLWATVTGGATLTKTVIGKPHQPTFEFAERRLWQFRKSLFGQIGLNDPLRRVYMIGDNPESDIRGANNYRSPNGSKWTSILVKTGVYQEGSEPSCKPDLILKDVREAVQWAIEDAKKS